MTKQIAVKLPEPLLAHIDELVAEGAFRSRSELVRHGVEAVIASTRRSATDEAFRLGYQRHPEDVGEMAEAERLALEAIHEEPWEPWW